jgi:hypothetical protein
LKLRYMPKTTIQIKGNVFWLVAYDKNARLWVAECPPLQIMAEADTLPKLRESINDCIQVLFADLLATGEFEGFLREHNWTTATPLPPRTSRVRFDIPYDIQRRSANDLAAVCC